MPKYNQFLSDVLDDGENRRHFNGHAKYKLTSYYRENPNWHKNMYSIELRDILKYARDIAYGLHESKR